MALVVSSHSGPTRWRSQHCHIPVPEGGTLCINNTVDMCVAMCLYDTVDMCVAMCLYNTVDMCVAMCLYNTVDVCVTRYVCDQCMSM